jgi:signal transduction histidine kinase
MPPATSKGSRSSVATRFAVAFGVAGSISLALVAAAATSLLSSRAATIEVTRDDVVRMRASQSLLSAFYGMQLGEDGYLTHVEPAYLAEFRASSKAADAALDELSGKGIEPFRLAKISQDLTIYRRLFEEQEEVLSGRVTTDNPAGFRQLMLDEDEVTKRLRATLTTLANEQVALTKERVGQMTDSLGQSVGLVLLSFFVALAALLFTYGVGREVAIDLTRLTAQVRDIANSGSLTQRVDGAGADELVQLAGAFNVLLEGQGAIAARAREIASGNFDGTLRGNGQLAETFTVMIESLRTSTGSLERMASAEREARTLLQGRVTIFREFIDRLAEGALSTRLQVEGEGELARLGVKLNSLAERLEAVETETRAAAQKLAQSEESFRSLSEQLPVAVSIYQDDGLVWANTGALKVMGATSFAQVQGTPILRPGAARELSAHDGHLGPSMLSETATRERELTGLDGVSRALEISSSALTFNGRPATASIALDVTERRALWRKMHFNERMVSLGTLAAGVAHEINNPIAFVSSNLTFANELVAELTHSDDRWTDLVAALSEAKEGVKRVTMIVKDLKSFARDEGTPVSAAIAVRPMVEFSIAMARKVVSDRAKILTSFEEVPAVNGTEGPLGQVFLNLLMNAAQAIAPGAPNDNVVEVGSRLESDGRVAVFVRDSGAGMTAEVRKRLFDPFFSTKPIGEGTGLGLSICLGIVRGLGGEIRVDSVPGTGSTFTVVLHAA